MKRFHKQRIPYVLTVGDKEVAENIVSVKCRKDGVITQVPVSEIADFLAARLKNKEN